MSLRRKIYYTFTLTVLAFLLVLPATGWLARIQLLPFTLSSINCSIVDGIHGNTNATKQLYRETAARTPTDVNLQLAAVQHNETTQDALPKLAELRQQFPQSPIVTATLLRGMTEKEVVLHRDEENLLTASSQNTNKPQYSGKPSDPVNVEKFIALAQQGEQQEPSNGYFSAMLAAGYFIAHEDTQAMQAWERAAQKPVWNDYVSDEIVARQKLLCAANGNSEVGFLPRISQSMLVASSHYAIVRATGRLATVKAIQAELAGNREEGMKLRVATRCVGEAMQIQSKSFIGNLVGRAIIGIASARPGGAEFPAHTPGKDGKRMAEERAAKYLSYLQTNGYTDEAKAFKLAREHGKTLSAIGTVGMQRSYLGAGTRMFQLLFCWLGDVFLLSGTFFALAFAGIFALVYKFSPRLQRNEPLQTSARWGVAVGAIFPIFLMLAALATMNRLFLDFKGLTDGNQGAEDAVALLVACSLGIAGLVIPPMWLKLSLQQIVHGLRVLGLTFLCVIVLGGVSTMLGCMFGGATQSLGTMLGALNEQTKTYWGILLPTLVAGIMMALPLLMVAVFAAFSQVLKIPVAAGITRGTRAMGVPLAAFLMLGWGICLVATVRQENKAVAEMNRISQIGELQTYAELAGKPFPK